MSISPSSDNNRGGGDFFMSVDSILAASRTPQVDPMGTVEWLSEARQSMRSLESEELLGGARQLLDEHPHAELSDLLRLPADERREELSTIRKHRRLFLVARDGIILSTDKHRTPEYNSLRRLCFSLGRYADSGGTSNLYAVTARSSLRNLVDAETEAHTYIHDDQRLRIKFLQALDGMGIQESFHEGDRPQSLHQRRKTFRRAVNALVLQAAQTGDTNDIRVAEGGLRINTAMGHISDSIGR